MPAPDRVLQLVDHFHANQAALRSSLYNETQARIDFINPLFEALGWDMANRRGLPLDQRQIDATDAQIDALVYDLYGLTEDEIRLVEGGG